MAGYIGPAPVPQATQTREVFTLSSTQTTVGTGGYTPGFVDVYLNGAKLAPADFTATNGSDIVLASGAAANDILEVVAFQEFTVVDQTFSGDITFTGANYNLVWDASDDALEFRDTALKISSSADGQLDFDADTEIEITAPTVQINASSVFDVNGNIDVSGTVTGTGTSVFASLDISGDIDVDGTTNLDVVDIDGAATIDLADGVADNAYALTVKNREATDDRSYGLLVHAGSTNTDRALVINDHDGSNALFYVHGNGNVALGITNATEKFTVVNSSSGIVGRFTNNTNQTLDLGVISGSGSAGGVSFNNANSGYLSFQSGGSEAMRIDSSGRVGIGISSLSRNLTVSSSSQTDLAIVAGASSSAQLQFGDSSDDNIGQIEYNNSTNGMSFYTNAGERLLINASGDAIIRTADRYLYANGTSGGTTIDAGFRFETSTPQLEFWVGDGERASINSSGALTVSGAGTFGGQVFTTVIGRANDTNTTIDFPGSDVIEMYTAGVLRTTLNSSGHLLIGKTADDNTTVGTVIHDNGFMSIARENNIAMILNRSNEGEILRLTEAGNERGSLHINNDRMLIDSEGDASGLRFDASSYTPFKNGSVANGTVDLGYANGQFKDLYLAGNVILADGAGISFAATAGPPDPSGSGASATSELLDDYEEGTWVPVITPEGGSAAGITNNHATYTKIGRMVFLQFDVKITSISGTSSSNAIELTGLPYARNTTAAGGPNIGYTNLNALGGGNLALQGNSTTKYRIVNLNLTTGDNASDHLAVNSFLRGQFSYNT